MSTAGCAGKTNSGATEASAASEQNTRETETSGSPAAERPLYRLRDHAEPPGLPGHGRYGKGSCGDVRDQDEVS